MGHNKIKERKKERKFSPLIAQQHLCIQVKEYIQGKEFFQVKEYSSEKSIQVKEKNTAQYIHILK